MKKYVSLLIAAGFIFPSLAFVSVAAETSPTPTTTTTTTTTKPAGDDTASREQRIKQRKTERSTKLTVAQTKKVTAACKAAQGKAASAQARTNELQKSRPEVYAKLLSRLGEITAKLQKKGIATTDLQAEITNLQSQIEAFKTGLTANQLSVNDLIAMDCAADPTGFQASLDAARAERDKLQTQSTAIKNYVNTTIKPTLKTLREQLAKTETTSKPTTSNSKEEKD